MVASTFIPPMVSNNPAFPRIPLGTIAFDYVELDTANFVVSKLSGLSSINGTTGSTTLTGNAATLFLTEVNIGDYLTWNNLVAPDNQLLAKVVNVIADDQLEFEPPLPAPISVAPVNYTNVDVYKCDVNALVSNQLFAEPDLVSPSVAAPAKRLYYNEYNAWDWNTNSMRNLAQDYATSVGGNVKDLGWIDLAGWQTAVNTLLTYAGWNVNAITNVVPDTTTINNLNQEIVVYYQNSTYTYNGLGTDSIETLVYYEESPAANNYKQIIGVNPFQTSTVFFDGTDFGGLYFDVNGNPIVFPPTPVLAQGAEQIPIGIFGITYNETPSSISFSNQNLTEGQFQVFVKYTTYDGVESVVAKKLVEMGITVNPENVSWYVKEMQDRNGLDEIEWTFDDEEEAPVQDEPQNFDPLSDNPTDYVPRNAKNNEESEEDAD
jgi:hypothetical protein